MVGRCWDSVESSVRSASVWSILALFVVRITAVNKLSLFHPPMALFYSVVPSIQYVVSLQLYNLSLRGVLGGGGLSSV
jgi:hypothetical protein